MPSASAKSRARRSRWRSTASAKVSPRPERISISGAISSPAADVGEHLVVLAGRVQLLEAVLELERGRVDDRELLLEPDREVGRLLERLADALEVERRVRPDGGLRGPVAQVR